MSQADDLIKYLQNEFRDVYSRRYPVRNVIINPLQKGQLEEMVTCYMAGVFKALQSFAVDPLLKNRVHEYWQSMFEPGFVAGREWQWWMPQ